MISVTKDVAREICQRQGLKAFLARLHHQPRTSYVITLEAINGQSGEEIAREATGGESKEQVLKALTQAASKLRQKLASRSARFRSSIAAGTTTSSLEALKAYSLAYEHASRGSFLESIPL